MKITDGISIMKSFFFKFRDAPWGYPSMTSAYTFCMLSGVPPFGGWLDLFDTHFLRPFLEFRLHPPPRYYVAFDHQTWLDPGGLIHVITLYKVVVVGRSGYVTK